MTLINNPKLSRHQGFWEPTALTQVVSIPAAELCSIEISPPHVRPRCAVDFASRTESPMSCCAKAPAPGMAAVKRMNRILEGSAEGTKA